MEGVCLECSHVPWQPWLCCFLCLGPFLISLPHLSRGWLWCPQCHGCPMPSPVAREQLEEAVSHRNPEISVGSDNCWEGWQGMRPHVGTGRVSGSTAGLCPPHPKSSCWRVQVWLRAGWAHCSVQVTLASVPQECNQLPVAMAEPYEGGEQHFPADTQLPSIGNRAAHTDTEAQGSALVPVLSCLRTQTHPRAGHGSIQTCTRGTMATHVCRGEGGHTHPRVPSCSEQKS